MALLFIDSFDHWGSTDTAIKWNTADASTNYTPSAGNGRNSSASLRCAGGSSIMKSVADTSNIIIGFAYRSSAYGNVFLQLRNGTTIHVDMRTSAGGAFQITRNGTLLATATTGFTTDTWYYLEFYITISDTVGTVKMQVNGATETLTFVTGTETTQDTRNGTPTTIDNVLLVNTTGTSDYDDFYLCNTSGSAPTNTFLGDCRVEALLPTGNGYSSQWNRLSGSNNYEMVDEASGDGDTTYVYETTANDIDSYAMANLAATSGTVYGVQTVLWARKDDAGIAQVKPHFYISSTPYARTTINLNDSYLMRLAIEEASPATASAWTISEINGAEFGVKCI